MRIAQYVPDLTPEEAQRFWMTPAQVCWLSMVGDPSDPKIKKMLNTLSDRGHIPFIKSGEAKTAPRLYSLVSAAMLRTIFEIIQDGRTYRYAEPVAQAVAKTLCKVAGDGMSLSDFDATYSAARIVFSGIKDDGTPASLKWVQGDVTDGGFDFCYSVFDAGYLILRICETYADYWAEDLEKRGAE